MDWQGDTNAHNATTTLKYNTARSGNYNSLNNVNLGSVSIGLNTAPSGAFIYKNVSPPVVNGFSFYNGKNIFS